MANLLSEHIRSQRWQLVQAQGNIGISFCEFQKAIILLGSAIDSAHGSFPLFIDTLKSPSGKVLSSMQSLGLVIGQDDC